MATLEELKVRLIAVIEGNKAENKRFEPVKILEAAAKKFKTAEGQDKAAAKKELETAFIAVEKAGFTLPAPLQIIFDQCSKAFGTAEKKTETEPQREIQNSVGDKGKNTPTDVLIVQILLNQKGANLKLTGICDENTIAAIKDFQKKIPLKNCDGLISPNGETWKKLYNDELPLPSNKTYNYQTIVLKLFEKGQLDANDIDPNDVLQGYLGNCYFMAGLAAVAKTNPETIRKLIKDNGDGSYDVTLYAKGDKIGLIPQVVTVKPQFPIDAKGNPVYGRTGDGELWVMIMEKAYAKLLGGYGAIEGGNPQDIISAITGEVPLEISLADLSEAQIVAIVQSKLLLNKPITASTLSGKGSLIASNGVKVIRNHAYTIMSINSKEIYLRNPWGHTDATISIADFKKFYRRISF